MSFTIVHCADVHLETTFPSMGGARRRIALQDAFTAIVDRAIALRADALTIGGDLFEAARAGPQTARFIIAQLARFGGRVFIAPGNHDPYHAGALLAQHGLPPNTRVFSDAMWQAAPLADGLTLYGFGHTPAEPGRPFANARFERGGTQLALVHGSDQDRCPPNKRATAPFTTAEIEASGATCVLTGHYHGGYTIERDGTPLLAYPGSPEPIKFGEQGEHGALVVRVDRGRVQIERIATARTRLLEVECSVDGAGDEATVRACVERSLAAFGRNEYVKLRLSGNVIPGTRVDAAALADEFGSALGALEIADTTIAHDYARLADEPTVRGRVVRDLLALTRGSDATAADDAAHALRYAMAAFDGGEIAP